MRWLLFLSRLAFICGICFLISLGMAAFNQTNDEPVSSTVIIIGYAMGLIVVPITDICYLVVMLMGRKLAKFVPLWLVIANVLFLFILLFYIFYLNDPYYHQS